LGIAQRQIHAKFSPKRGRSNHRNPLPVNIETIGDWIKVQREAKNLTSGHVAAKMGIARAVVRSWERGASQPDSQQLKVLAHLFGVDPTTETAFAALVSTAGNTDVVVPS
jgi:ribosome-binding protein aMBF1 (putative translation factor)